MTGFGRFNLLTDVAADKFGNVYVADYNNSTIRKITPAGEVTTIAGKAGNPGSANGTNSQARFNNPICVAVDTNGTLYVSDRGNRTIRKITQSGTIWTVTTLAGSTGNPGTNDGFAISQARFQYTHGVAVDKAGNVYVADRGGHTIRKIFRNETFDVVVKTIVGTPLQFAIPGVDGTNSDVRFGNDAPTGLTVDNAGNLYTTDLNNYTVLKITPVGTNWVVTTIAGSSSVSGFEDGTNSDAHFSQAFNLTVDSAGNLYVADTGFGTFFGQTIRKIAPVGTNWVVTTIAGSPGVAGSDDGVGSTALFNLPYGIAVDSSGTLYVADYQNSRVTKGTPPAPPPTPPNLTIINFVTGNVQIDFTSGATDTPDLFTLQSSSTVVPTSAYADVAPPATITHLGPGSFRAVVAPSGDKQFYRIKRTQ